MIDQTSSVVFEDLIPDTGFSWRQCGKIRKSSGLDSYGLVVKRVMQVYPDAAVKLERRLRRLPHGQAWDQHRSGKNHRKDRVSSKVHGVDYNYTLTCAIRL